MATYLVSTSLLRTIVLVFESLAELILKYYFECNTKTNSKVGVGGFRMLQSHRFTRLELNFFFLIK